MSCPYALLELARHDFFAGQVDYQTPARLEAFIKYPRNFQVLRRVIEVSKGGEHVDRGIKGIGRMESASVALDKVDFQTFRCGLCAGSVKISAGAVDRRHDEAAAREIQRVASDAAAEIEHRCPLRQFQQ